MIYSDNLILITTAFRGTTRNIKICLAIYASLIEQNPNLVKSEVFLSLLSLILELLVELDLSLVLLTTPTLSRCLDFSKEVGCLFSKL